MINRLELKSFGPLGEIDWQNLSKINLIIGANSTGKTFALKSLYASLRTLEEYRRGNDQRSASEILAEKLYWTFQPDKIGDLVTRGSDIPLFSCISIDGRDFSFSFGKDTTRQISTLENHVPPRESNSVFLPAKEVLSLHNVILKSRDQDRAFGFDDTYYDLAKAILISTSKGRNYKEFAQSRKDLDDMLGGSVEFDEKSGRWLFVKGRSKFPLGVTSEGIKKIAILDTLLGNRYLGVNSVVVIDEIESALHPTAITRLLDIISMLSERGIQFFIASHSYFVVKKLYLISQQKKLSIPVLSMKEGAVQYSDLEWGMPDNSIVRESVRLYEEEIGLALG